MGEYISNRTRASCERELSRLREREKKRGARECGHHIELPLPEKVKRLLDASFAKVFDVVFVHGGAVTVGKTERIREGFEVLDYAVGRRGRRRDVKRLRKSSRRANRALTALTAAEGITLGAFGIGVPDAAIFTAVLLRGVFRTALRFGVDTDDAGERYLLLCMMEASLLDGGAFADADRKIDEMLTSPHTPTERETREQSRRTAHALSDAMMTMKFVQGIPIAGIAGGMHDPVCYGRVVGYVEEKLYKRYLLAHTDG